jgi:hypothetical protein
VKVRIVGTEALSFLDRLFRDVEGVRLECRRGSNETSFEPPPAHPQLKALPLFRRSVRLGHDLAHAKIEL